MLTVSDVEHVARLASLSLTEEEKKLFCQQLGEILDFAGQLNEIDTEGVEPAFHSIPLTNIFREDRLHKSMEIELALANAPEREENYFKIPRIIGYDISKLMTGN